MTLAEFWPVWAADARERLARSTMREYERLWSRRLEPQFGTRVLDGIKPRDVSAWRSQLLAAGVGPEATRYAMVLLQSMSLGKPVIISRTRTTEEYGEHMKSLYFVEYGSEAALRDAIRQLDGNAELRARIGAAARRHYEARHTVAAYTNGVLTAVEKLLLRQETSTLLSALS